ncbi:MAG: NADH-quinone oxidoreductase subunit J [Candidatus Electryoneaceae bacterium]|nr:NADH-quinone oxidoreductase subunit J [Candidatus Electryoneaceae bacterium]
MEAILFIITALIAVVSALLVITGRQPVYSVLFLILTFFCVAILYVMLGAQFIAAMQVIVYAGAIMVLFMFVVMLLNLRDKQKWEVTNTLRKGLGFAVAGGVLLIIATALKSSFNATAELSKDYGTVGAVGDLLFQRFLLPFEVASVLLLTAIIGVVMMVKRQQRSDDPESPELSTTPTEGGS